MRKYILLSAVLISMVVCLGMTSCKAWRTISTTATCVEQTDSTKTTVTIATKTVEVYQGVKK